MPNKICRFYPKAIEDLESIYSYGVDKFGIKRTEDYILAINTSLQHLASDPLISRKCEDIRKGLRVFNIGSHVIFFKITDGGIVVIRILHQSMDFKRHF